MIKNKNMVFMENELLFSLLKEDLNNGNKAVFCVSGSSMYPFIVHNRDHVEIEHVEAMSLKKGDIILFSPLEEKYVLHRITEITSKGFITTGDGNLYRDGLVKAENIIGKVSKIYRNKLEIDCGKIRWKIAFRIWMFLFPVRRWIFALIKLKHRLGRLHADVVKLLECR